MAGQPVAKYRLTIEVIGNTQDEIDRALSDLIGGGALHRLRQGYNTGTVYGDRERDQFEVVYGRTTVRLEHTNPDMTPERYDREMKVWRKGRKFSPPQ